MFDRYRSIPEIAAAGALVVVALILVALGGGGTSAGVGAGGWFGRGLGWVQGTQRGAVGQVGGWWDAWTESAVERQNERLRKRVGRLREEKSRLIGILQENARLRELVGFERDHPEYELAPAEVVGRDSTPYFRVTRLRVESPAELAPRMPVVAADGVVGQVRNVSGAYADVVIVSDPRSRIDVFSQRNRAQGVVEGLGHERDYLARVAYLRQEDEVREGDAMVTSGMAGVFPADLAVGTIDEVVRSEEGVFQEARLKPAVDFSRLEEVFVVTGVDK